MIYQNSTNDELLFLAKNSTDVIKTSYDNIEKISKEKSKKIASHRETIRKINGKLTVMLKGAESEIKRFNDIVDQLKLNGISDIPSLPTCPSLEFVEPDEIEYFLDRKYSGYTKKKPTGRPKGSLNSKKVKIENIETSVVSESKFVEHEEEETKEIEEVVEEKSVSNIVVTDTIRNELTGEVVELTDDELQELLRLSSMLPS